MGKDEERMRKDWGKNEESMGNSMGKG